MYKKAWCFTFKINLIYFASTSKFDCLDNFCEGNMTVCAGEMFFFS